MPWPTSGSRRRATPRDGFGEPGPRALDLRGLGTRDYSSAAWADPQIEYVVADGPSPGTWKGLPAMAEHMREALSAWKGLRSQAAEYRELDDERILVLLGFRGRGKASGLDVEQLGTKGAEVFHLRDGKVTRLVLHWDRERALADLGLAPEGDAA